MIFLLSASHALSFPSFSLLTSLFSLPSLAAQGRRVPPANEPPARAASFLRNLTNPRERREARPDLLDAPALPGSVMKVVTLAAALEAGVVRPGTGAMCRRVVTVDGTRYVCAHPDLKRPLTPAEALAHSCNDFFVSLAPRLSREQVNRTRLAAGLPPLGAGTRLAAALVGLDGPRVSPRTLIDVVARLAGVGTDPPVPMSPEARGVLLEGLAGAAAYGTASAIGERGLTALAKTGTAPMPGGGAAGIVVALTPASKPTHGLVVVAPGAAGLDAAAIAADLVAAAQAGAAKPATPSTVPPPATPVSPPAAVAAPPLTLRLGRTAPNGRVRVETLAVDDYIAQVLAGEGQPTAGDAAQQALAITARTFAEANRQRHRREGFDVCDTTHCQVVRPSTATTRRAAAATAGQVLLDNGRPANVFYSASCGGRIERASQVWPGSIDLAHPETDDACAEEPAWFSDVRVRDLERALRAAGLRGGRLRELRILQRNASGRVIRLRADGFSPPEISGTDLRMALGRVGGWQLMKSTSFDVQRTSTGYRFRGRGFGHGVGLCVIGTGVRARRGETAEAILRFYFPSLSIGTASGAPSTTPASPRTTGALPSEAEPSPPAVVPSGAAAADGPRDVLLAVPVAEESERDTLLALVRRARDEIAAAAGQKPPPTLRMTVHPTVQSFARATGQPWWVSGATAGQNIDLVPVALLRQRGQVERTVRHEVAHVLLDGALANRPMWVREGAALFFSRTADERVDGGRPPRGRAGCPTDQELLRAVSAGAQRDAYARAEACFARQISAGKKWSEVR